MNIIEKMPNSLKILDRSIKKSKFLKYTLTPPIKVYKSLLILINFCFSYTIFSYTP